MYSNYVPIEVAINKYRLMQLRRDYLIVLIILPLEECPFADYRTEHADS